MRRRSAEVFIAIFVCALWWGLAPASALSFHATLDPIRVYPKPGEVVSRTFELTLAKDEQTCHLRAHIQDFWLSEDSRQTFYREPGSPEAPKHSCASWIALNPGEAQVDPGATLTVKVTISVPPDAKPGGYWCAFTLDELPNPLTNPPGVGMRFYTSLSVGIYVYLAPIERKARITAVRMFPDRAEVSLRNEGNCPLGVQGRLEFLKPGAEHPTDVIVIPRSPLLTEPSLDATITVPLDDPAKLPSGDYLVRAILDIGTDYYLGVQKEMVLDRGGKSAAPPP